jgi:hypothetical protein
LSKRPQLAALYSVALLSQIGKLDHFETSSIVQSVCVNCQTVADVPEYLISLIPTVAGFEGNLPCLRKQKGLEAALVKAEQWFTSGVRVCLTKQNQKLQTITDYSEVVFTFGEIGILENTLAMIVNSRVSRKIYPNTPWVLKTIGLAHYATKNKWTLVSSCGSIPYLLVSWLAKGRSSVIVLDSPLPFMGSGRIRENFNQEFMNIFDIERTLFISEFGMGLLPNAGRRMMNRDAMAVSIADVLLPCKVRPDGNMEKLITSARAKGKIIFHSDNSETTSNSRKTNDASLPWASRKIRFNKSADFFPKSAHPENPFADYFFHYTRACFGPWPGQSWADYLHELTANEVGSQHEAVDALRRILKEKRIRASGRWIRGAYQVVSFTERSPEEFDIICKWRRGLVRKTFEPCGIAVKRSVLIEKGARKVSYGSEELFKNMTDEIKPYFQKASSSCAEWSREKEWRLIGDLKFNNINQSDWFAMVPSLIDLDNLVKTFEAEEFRMLVFGNAVGKEAGNQSQSHPNKFVTIS